MGLEFIKSQKGSDNLVFLGHLFTKDGGNKNEGTTYWKCIEYKRCFCRGRATTKDDSVVTHSSHNHPPDAAKIASRKVVISLKRKAVETLEPSSKILSDASQDISVAVAGKLPTIAALTRTIQRRRKEVNFPLALPRSLATLNIPLEYKQIQLHNEIHNFLCYDDGPVEDRILVFATTSNLRMLELSQRVYGDGTFKVAPKLFTQLYTLHGIVDGCTLPLIYALLPNKEYVTYKKMLLAIKTRIPDWNPVSITTDFEAAALKGFGECFPASTQRGCYFHFGQCLWRKIQGLKTISERYKDDPDYALSIRLLGALAFIPPEDVVYAYEAIQRTNIYQEGGEIDQLLHYFQETWVGKLNPYGRGREQPLFPINLWNCYETTLRGEARTTNSLEGWHRAFDVRVGACHPNIWRFLDTLKKEHIYNSLKIEQQLAGAPLPAQRKKYRDLAKRILNNTQKYGALPKTVIQSADGLTFTIPPDVAGNILGMENPTLAFLEDQEGDGAVGNAFKLFPAQTELVNYLRSIAHNLEFNV